MTRRTDRVAEAIRRLTSEILHNQMRDPRVSGFVTITRVEVTPDLRLAKIYYSVMGDDKKKKLVSQGFESAKKFIRKHIADELKLRYTPEVSIRVDKAVEYNDRIDEILDQIHKEREDDGTQ